MAIALGTHDHMSDSAIGKLMGCAPGRSEEIFPGWNIHNHDWRNEEAFADLGAVPAARIAELTGGRLADRDRWVLVNQMVVDTVISPVLGPVLPHEVVGIFGGNKFLLSRAVRS